MSKKKIYGYKISYQDFEGTEFSKTDEPIDGVKVFKTLSQCKKKAISNLKFLIKEVNMNIDNIKLVTENHLES